MDKIFIPVNINNTHWCLAVIYVQEKEIRYYDSLSGESGTFVMENLSQFLGDEMTHRKQIYLDTSSEWTRVLKPPGTPQQTNSVDCGVFTTMYAHFISANQPISFTREQIDTIRFYLTHKILMANSEIIEL